MIIQSANVKGKINKAASSIVGTLSKPKIITDDETVFILEDEAGKQIVAVLVDEVSAFDATANDIRIGKTAVTDEGVTVGEKIIPTYNTLVGIKVVTAGSLLSIPNNDSRVDYHDYTKLQTVVCKFNKNISGSVQTEKVSVDDKVYNVQSTEALSTIIKNHDNRSIDFGIVNDSGAPCIIRYFTYKEVL